MVKVFSTQVKTLLDRHQRTKHVRSALSVRGALESPSSEAVLSTSQYHLEAYSYGAIWNALVLLTTRSSTFRFSAAFLVPAAR